MVFHQCREEIVVLGRFLRVDETENESRVFRTSGFRLGFFWEGQNGSVGQTRRIAPITQLPTEIMFISVRLFRKTEMTFFNEYCRFHLLFVHP